MCVVKQIKSHCFIYLDGEEVARFLVDNGADINAKDNKGKLLFKMNIVKDNKANGRIGTDTSKSNQRDQKVSNASKKDRMALKKL